MGNTASAYRFRRRRQLDESSIPDLLYTKPSGLYPTCSWDVKSVRRQILRGELAPRYPGRDAPTSEIREECPICMLVYPVLNQTRCCAARLCTECYLQIRPPRHSREPCPFCKHRRFDAVYVGPKDADVLDAEERDQIRAADAMRRESQAAAAASTPAMPETHLGLSPHASCPCLDLRLPQGKQLTPHTHIHNQSQQCPEHHHRTRYYHDPTSSLDPLLLEAMASEVTYASPPGSAADRASASSSGLLESHARELRADHLGPGGSESGEDSSSYLAEMHHRVVRLPWYGIDVDRTPVDGTSEDDELFRDEKLSLNEAIRRSLIEM